MSTTVEQLIAHKGRHYYFVDADASVLHASQMLADRNVGALLVFDGDDLIGILSERDCVRRVLAKQRDALTTTVRDVMTPVPITVSAHETIEHCMTLMTNARFRHLPVTEGSQVVGVITLGDAVHAVLRDREHTIEDLEGYIHGTPSVRPHAF